MEKNNNLKIKELENKIENLYIELNEKTKKFSLANSRRDKQTKTLSKISIVILCASLTTTSFMIINMMLGTVNVALMITTLFLIMIGLDMYRESIQTFKENKEIKDHFNIEIQKEYEKIKSYEDVLAIRKILKDCFESNFMGQYDEKEILEKMSNPIMKEELSNEELLTILKNTKSLASARILVEKYEKQILKLENKLSEITNPIQHILSEKNQEEKGIQKVKK